MPKTPNHGYNVPNEGQEDWHVPLNENFEQFDADIEIRDVSSNRDQYEPKEGAKFLDTDTGEMFVGTGSQWTPIQTTGNQPTLEELKIGGGRLIELETGFEQKGRIWTETGDMIVTGPFLRLSSEDPININGGDDADPPLIIDGKNNWNLDDSDGDVYIGDPDYRLAIGVSLGGAGAGTARLRAKGGTAQLKLGAGQSDTVNVQESSVTVNGDFDVSGNKNFTQTVDTGDGEKEVVYTASEAPTARTETSGVAELDDGRAEVDLPEHFGWVTDGEELLVIETTPYSADSSGLAVVERSADRIVVEDLDGEGDYEFAYTVKGTRDGHADKQVVREPTAEGTGQATQTLADD